MIVRATRPRAKKFHESENPKRDATVESHPCAQNAQGWGTRPWNPAFSPTTRKAHPTAPTFTFAKKENSNGKGGGQECPPHITVFAYSTPNSFASAFHL